MNFIPSSRLLTKTYLLTTLLTACSFTSLLSSVASASTPPPPSTTSALHNQVSALYQQLVSAANIFQKSSLQLCQSPSAETLTSTQNSWRHLMNSWMAAEVINFGPVQQDNMAWRFQFWPDKKNLIKRKVEGFLTAHPKIETITPDTIQNASVLVQGLSAAEYLLFDPQLKKQQQVNKNPLRCQILSSISSNLFANSQLLAKGWQTEVITQKQSTEDNISQLLNGIATLIERSHKKLVMPLGKQKANPYFAESWRSQHSLENIKHNLTSIEQLYRTLLKPLLLKKPQGQQLATQIEQQFALTYKQTSQFEQSIFALLQQQQLDKTKQLANHVKQLKQLFSQQLPDKLAVIISFNANDGD